VVLDRFCGGGASALSGGVVYAGGGTQQQREAGVTDSVQAMYDYLRLEVGDVVSRETLLRFCEHSADMLTWLEQLGVPFEGSLCPDKTSYPTNRHYLYYSGSETSAPFRDIAPPAPRGHRPRGRGTSGKVLYARLAAAARDAGARVFIQTRAVRLTTDDDGRVVGVECRSLSGGPRWARLAHRLLHRLASKPWLYVPRLGRTLHRPVDWLERRYARPLRVTAEHGVVLCAGGFVANRELMRRYAPAYRGGLPLGTPADDGSGIRLGSEVGGATSGLDRISAWRFLSPPSAFLRGVLVGPDGSRVCDESRYGAAVGHAIVTRHAGRAWLLVDRRIVAQARRQLRRQTLWFQRSQAWYLLTVARVSAPRLEEVAAQAGVDPQGLRDTVAAYHAAIRTGAGDPAGKAAELVEPLEPPYSLIDVSVRPRPGYPCPMLTLGGLVVDEDSGQVRRDDGTPVPGLYAAGRSAVGVCSKSYVSGLSLADCVFSGRRAGRDVAATGRSGARR
jgi:3-oxo-5alpha-steroid 4-dehydrogenase